ncbi:MAG TPA: hypothetical protein VNO18_10345, partial [Xanthobacteraceae bacterium]|nr:hypothetical protein [Xanthobacteraceae bacterium]
SGHEAMQAASPPLTQKQFWHQRSSQLVMMILRSGLDQPHAKPAGPMHIAPHVLNSKRARKN